MRAMFSNFTKIKFEFILLFFGYFYTDGAVLSDSLVAYYPKCIFPQFA